MGLKSLDDGFSWTIAGPEVKDQLIQDLDVPLTELIAQLVENATTDDFSTMLRLLIEGLNVCNLWKQNPEVGTMLFFF